MSFKIKSNPLLFLIIIVTAFVQYTAPLKTSQADFETIISNLEFIEGAFPIKYGVFKVNHKKD